MMVIFTSQCEKKALSRSRRVLDSFANRIGDSAWKTVITQEGLAAVRKLLRKSASKNTAVSCHWVRSRSRTDLMWVVGNRDKFDNQGSVPVNHTNVNRLYNDALADWQYLPLIQALSVMAALLHDWGKASQRFQQKLKKDYRGNSADALRHEWVSCLLLKAFISRFSIENDEAWLTSLAKGEINEELLKQADLSALEKPLYNIPPIAQLLAWLIVSHHRLPNIKPNLAKEKRNDASPELNELLYSVSSSWGYQNSHNQAEIKACLNFPSGLLTDSSRWLKAVKRWARKLLSLNDLVNKAMGDGSYRLILHHARLSLMLADHCYSSQEKDDSWRGGVDLIANTDSNGDEKQRLDQHLVRVADYAKENVRNLPRFERESLRSFDVAQLKKPSPYTQGKFDYRWQDKAAKEILRWREVYEGKYKKQKSGFFAVNMASTGCGKTFANAKVMRALAEDKNSLRYVLALGLRTLTLQTGDEYREKIFPNGDGSDLAVLIGSKAVLDLHASANDQVKEETVANSGSESIETLLNANDVVDYDGEIPEEGLSTVLQSAKDRQFLHAPVLACTIDHLMPATECTRGGRYILPSLRLMSSDLVIDEIDDFIGADSIAIGRLIHMAGMLGRKVMISSATVTPGTALGYFKAYLAGWRIYATSCNANSQIGCAWIDEFRTMTNSVHDPNFHAAGDVYEKQHQNFIERRVRDLRKQLARRKAFLVPCDHLLQELPEEKEQGYFTTIAKSIDALHRQHNYWHEDSRLSISFGVVRMANINPCVALTRYLLSCEWPEDSEIRVMPYHSQQVLLLRNAQEQHLDAVLKRKEAVGEHPNALFNPEIDRHIRNIKSECNGVMHLVFILVATPVEEVGRDHDFDWAIVEPSSYRSIVQLAGRVKRHRSEATISANIGILQYNWKAVQSGNTEGEVFFNRPGYESKEEIIVDGHRKPTRFRSHNLEELLDFKQLGEALNAIPRIQKNEDKNILAKLEHDVIFHNLNHTALGPSTLFGYLNQHWYLTGMPQTLNRFRASEPSFQLYLVCQNSDCFFVEKDDKGKVIKLDNGDLCNREEYFEIERFSINQKEQNRLWLNRNYLQLLGSKALQFDSENYPMSLRFGELSIRESSGSYYYNDQLGLFKSNSNIQGGKPNA